MIKVYQMENDRGRAVADQFIIETEEGRYFQSYKSIIAFKPNASYRTGLGSNKIQLSDRYWNYSKTTSKYRNRFLGEATAETKRKIKAGEYIVTHDLNEGE